MKKLPNTLQSTVKIRFQDCDPFNHLNNAAYLNYFVNAREDQILEQYGIDIYEMASTIGVSWVVGSNQIAYINPAFLMEEVIIESQLLSFDETSLFIEFILTLLIKSFKFNQLHCLGRPVVAPYSSPISLICANIGSSPSNSFEPTYVSYTLATPQTSRIAFGGTPFNIAPPTVQ